MNLSTLGTRCFCYYYYYYYYYYLLLFLKVSGTQGIKLPNIILLKQTGNKQAISAFHISQAVPIKTHICVHANRLNGRKK